MSILEFSTKQNTIKHEGEINTFTDIQKLKRSRTKNSALQETFQEVLMKEGKII